MTRGLVRPIARGLTRSLTSRGTAAAGGGPSYLLDTYSGAAAAYSLRRLNTAYTGPVVQVRRSGDSAEDTFSATEVGDGTLAAWVTAGGGTEDGFVKTWYDQSGNGNDASQATAGNQPQIVASGAVLLENGRPAIEFDEPSSNTLKIADFGYNVAGGNFSIFSVAKAVSNTGANRYIIGQYETNSNQRSWAVIYSDVGRFEIISSFDGSSTSLQINTFDSVSLNTQYLNSWFFNMGLSANDRLTGRFNGTDFTQSLRTGDVSSLYNSSGNLSIGSALASGNATAGFDGLIQEIIFYDFDQSSSLTGIESNIASHYGITLP